MQPREERLLDAFLNGNDTAFEELIRENRDRLYRVAMRILRNHEDSLDTIQDSLVKAYRQAPGFRRESSFSTWLTSIVVREAINRAKRDRFRNAVSLHLLGSRRSNSGAGMAARARPVALSDSGTDGRSSSVTRRDKATVHAAVPLSTTYCAGPDEQAEAVILAGKIRQAVDSLPPVQRAVFAMKQYEGFTISEIAQLTGTTEGTVKANYFLAVRRLRLKLSPFLERGEKS